MVYALRWAKIPYLMDKPTKENGLTVRKMVSVRKHTLMEPITSESSRIVGDRGSEHIPMPMAKSTSEPGNGTRDMAKDR